MPNTIAHFAVNGLVSRAIIKDADLKWIYLACVIPDLPWILQRIVKTLPVTIDLYDLRAYCIVQSSFLLCIILCCAFSALAKQRTKIFIILVIGCLLHLLVDALQIKWANGVQLLAPFDWQLFRLDYFWPESLGTYLLTVAGFLYLLFYFRKAIQPNCQEFVIQSKSVAVSVLFVLIWLALPIVFIPKAYEANNHFISTLKNIESRSGKQVEIDRNRYVVDRSGHRVESSYGEKIYLENIQQSNAKSGNKISLRGKFTDKHTVQVDHYHLHSQFRDYASMLGLVCVLIIWLIFIFRCGLHRLKT